MRLKTKRLGDNWWIVGDEDYGPYGPYDVKEDADSDRLGVQRTLQNWNDSKFCTTEKIK